MSAQSDALNAAARAAGAHLPRAHEKGQALADPELPYVKLPRQGEQMLTFARTVGKIVGSNGLFRREMVPVTINPETARLDEMTPERFQTYVENHLTGFVERVTAEGFRKIRTTMNMSEAKTCLSCDDFRSPLRKLKRINQARLPIARQDGRIELLPLGYDQESGIYTVKNAFPYDEDWTLDRAKFFLEDLLSEFPFTDERSKAVHVLAMVAMFAGALQPLEAKRLNFIYRANIPRSGKGLLVTMALVGPCGPVQVQSIPDSMEEFRKILDTEALNGSHYIFFDEIQRKLVNHTLTAFMTAATWTGRLMNSQRKFVVPQISTVFLAGNSVEVSPDLAGRCLLVDLFTVEADAQAREIKHVIDESYLAKPSIRADILAALWALVRAWDSALPIARPRPETVFRGFENFSNIFGGIVQCAGFGNPLVSTAAEVDPDFADMKAVVEKLSENLARGRTAYEFEQVVEACRSVAAFEWRVSNKGDDLSPGSKSWLGTLFSKRYGGTLFTLADGRRVRFGHRGRNRQRLYTVELVGRADL